MKMKVKVVLKIKNNNNNEWTSRLLPYPGYSKQCSSEHWGTRVFFNSGFLGVCAQQWDCWVVIATLFKSTQHSQAVCPEYSPGPGTPTIVTEIRKLGHIYSFPLPLTLRQRFCKAPFSPTLYKDIVPTNV